MEFGQKYQSVSHSAVGIKSKDLSYLHLSSLAQFPLDNAKLGQRNLMLVEHLPPIFADNLMGAF